MSKKLVFCTLLLLFHWAGFAQVTVETCYQRAQANYPLIKQYGLIAQTQEYNLANVNRGYLPQVSLSAKATYQSEVAQLPIDFAQLGMPGVAIPTLNRDQYGITVDVNQVLWDGGAIKAQQEAIRATAAVDKGQVEVSLYALNERVNQLFFGILLAEAQLRQNGVLQQELARKQEQVLAYIAQGVANVSDADAIRVDWLQARQDSIRLSTTRKAYIAMLSLLTGEELPLNTQFVRPEAVYTPSREILRPELAAFDAQIWALEVKKREINSSLMPKVGFFVTGGYGNPGLNMLKRGFAPYYIGGLKLSWNIGSFYTKKDRRNALLAGMRSVATQREVFVFNTQLTISQLDNTIAGYREQLRYDDEIIALRRAVKVVSEAKLADGTLSGTDLMRDIHAEQLAIQDKIYHEMELLLSLYNLKFTTNK